MLSDCLSENPLPIHVMLNSRKRRFQSKKLIMHSSPDTLNPSLLVRISEGIYCVSPTYLPFTFARTHSVLEIAYLISELCGTYSLERPSGKLRQRRRPLTSIKKICALSVAHPEWRGAQKVFQAALLACSRSASPMETKLYLRMTLPFNKGGYNFGNIIMNSSVEVQQLIRTSRQLTVRKPDLLLGRRKTENNSNSNSSFKYVAIDYNGVQHAATENILSDTTRFNELLGVGVHDYAIWKSQYDNLTYMDHLVGLIRRDLGLPPHRVSRQEATSEKHAREELWRMLEDIGKRFK